MAISNLSLANTFFEWMTRTNQIIVATNNILEGYFNKTLGTIELSNSTYANSNVTLNVSNGYIKGNGIGLTNIPNTSITGRMTNSQLQNTTINLSSNSVALVVESSSVALGGSNLVLNLSTNSTYTNTHSNTLSTAAAVNSLHSLVVTQNTNTYSYFTGMVANVNSNVANIVAVSASMQNVREQIHSLSLIL